MILLKVRGLRSVLSLGSSRGQGSFQFLQVLVGIVIILVLGVVYVAIQMANSTLNDAIQSDTDLSNISKVVAQDNADAYPSVFDGGVAFVMVALFIVVLALAYNANTNPLLAVVAIVIIAALGFVGMLLSNTWDSFNADADLSTFASDFPMTNFILSNYLTVILVMSFSAMGAYLFAGVGGYG